MTQQKEVEDMEKFMNILMEVKVSLAEQNGKLDSLLDMKEKINETYDIARRVEIQTNENTKDITELKKSVNKKADKSEVDKKASKDEVERIIKQRDNLFRNLPSWLALLISLAVFLLTYLVN